MCLQFGGYIWICTCRMYFKSTLIRTHSFRRMQLYHSIQVCLHIISCWQRHSYLCEMRPGSINLKHCANQDVTQKDPPQSIWHDLLLKLIPVNTFLQLIKVTSMKNPSTARPSEVFTASSRVRSFRLLTMCICARTSFKSSCIRRYQETTITVDLC